MYQFAQFGLTPKQVMAEYGAGGGITWDSELTDEYEETLLKAKLLTVVRPEFQLLESFRLENGEYYLFENHMERLITGR